MAQANQKGLSQSSPVNGLIYSGDYTVKALSIVTSDGIIIDIKNLAIEINIFQDLFAPCISGSILMGEALDLLANYKLQGNEWLLMDIDKPSLNMPLKKVFRIYKVADREIKTSLQNYVIYFCSEENVLSLQYLISKAYNGMLVSDMIKDILVNKLGVPSKKINFWDTTEGIFTFIVPRMNPFEAIEWLSTRAYNGNDATYLFYEDNIGYNLRSYNNLINQKVYQTYYKRPKVETFNPPENVNSVNILKIVQDFDIIESGRYGAYSGSLYVYDLVNHKLVNYPSDYNNYKLLNDAVPINNSQNRFKSTLTNSYDMFFKFTPVFDSDQTMNPIHPENFLLKKAMKLAQMHTFKIIASIPGDINMQVGNIIQLEIPKAVPQNDKMQINEMRTGKYLVTAVHHVFMNDLMSTVVELVSDSINGALNAADNSGQALITIKEM